MNIKHTEQPKSSISRGLRSPSLIHGHLLASWLCQSNSWKPHPPSPPTPCVSLFSQPALWQNWPYRDSGFPAPRCPPPPASLLSPLAFDPAGLSPSAHPLAGSLGLVIVTLHVSRAGDLLQPAPPPQQGYLFIIILILQKKKQAQN